MLPGCTISQQTPGPSLLCRTARVSGMARGPKSAASRLISTLVRIAHRPRAEARGQNCGLASLLAVLPLSALLLTSCGYRVVGTADTIPDTVQTIAITTFQNATTEYKIEQHLTTSIVREFISRTRYQIVSDEQNADAILSGTVLNFLLFPTVFDPFSGRATSISSLTQVHVTLRDRKTGAVIYENPSMEFRERYEVSTVPEAYFEEREAALVRTSQTLARSLVSAILSGF